MALVTRLLIYLIKNEQIQPIQTGSSLSISNFKGNTFRQNKLGSWIFFICFTAPNRFLWELDSSSNCVIPILLEIQNIVQ